jgi:phosphomannomutase
MGLENIFHNYDIRGLFGSQLTGEIANKIAKAYVVFTKPKDVVVGMDCRLSSPEIKQQIVAGLLAMGVNVTDIGLVSTDVLYFATWKYGFAGGIMITASHMPAEHNGLKFLRLDNGMLSPIGRGVGMEELEKIYLDETWSVSDKQGMLKQQDVWGDFVNFTRSFVNISALKNFNIVMDAGNGMAGLVVDKVFAGLNLNIDKMFFEPDGNFPNHQANPLVEENRLDIIKRVKETKPDLGIAWDADCDRVYFIDENGQFVNGDFVVALLAVYFLKKNMGAGVVYDLRCSQAVSDLVGKMGGKAYSERVGHTYIKKRMRETKSIFGGELSGHYYFSANAYMENGFAPALIILEMMSKSGKTLSQLIKDLGDYYVSGEINFSVNNIPGVLKSLEDKYGPEAEIEKVDGISFKFTDWSFNVRPSANDPVLRLNLEANNKMLLGVKLKEVSEEIKKDVVLNNV